MAVREILFSFVGKRDPFVHEQAARLQGLQGAAFRKAAGERSGVDWHDSR